MPPELLPPVPALLDCPPFSPLPAALDAPAWIPAVPPELEAVPPFACDAPEAPALELDLPAEPVVLLLPPPG